MSADDVGRDEDEEFGVGLLLAAVSQSLVHARDLSHAERAGERALVALGEVSDDDGGLAFAQAHRAGELTIGDDGNAVEGLSAKRADLEVEIERDARLIA